MFQAAMAAPDAPDEPGRIAAGLAHAVKDACATRGLAAAEITAWGPIVTMIFSDTAAWEAVVVGPDAYQFYPGFIRDDEIVWPNIWVADNYPLEHFMRELAAELIAASGGKCSVEESS